jgi:hypothetical protein
VRICAPKSSDLISQGLACACMACAVGSGWLYAAASSLPGLGARVARSLWPHKPLHRRYVRTLGEGEREPDGVLARRCPHASSSPQGCPMRSSRRSRSRLGARACSIRPSSTDHACCSSCWGTSGSRPRARRLPRPRS